jgi:endonuclease/exonuclease/phosphatase (EEP) superfamily protein YafD
LEADHFWVDALACLDSRFPHRVKHSQDNAYGVLLLSKLELRDADVRFLMDPDVPSIVARVALRSGDEIDFYAIHPRPPHAFQASTDRDAETPGGRARDPRARRAGGGRGRPERRRLVTRHPPVPPAQRHARPAHRARPVRHLQRARCPLLRWPLDHIFFTEDFRVVCPERMGFIGSDHFPILVELSYEPEAADEREARAMAPGDPAMVRRKIRRARASS